MVHPGKPSRACQTCRQRRIKCDESTPACSQCSRSHRKCPGYRHPFDLVLRDETLSTAARVHRPTITAAATTSTIPPPPPSQHEHQALCYFFANYVLLPQASERPFLDFLLPLYRNASPLLSIAVSAVSLAALGNTYGARCLLQQARDYYTKALAATNTALTDAREAKSDHTLVAVVLMTLYESLSWTPQSLNSWGSHVAGACALLKLRGKAQLTTVTGLSIFILVRTQAIIRSLSRAEPLDPILKEWSHEAFAENIAANALTRCLLLLPDLLGRAKMMRDTAAAQELLEAVEALEAQLTEWPEKLPVVWRYWREEEGEEGREDEGMWGGKDMYQDIWIASVWNYYRTARIFAHMLRIQCLVRLGDVGATHRESVQVVKQMVDEICASLPFHMKVGALGGYFLLWPLLVAVNLEVVQKGQRDWIKGRLEVIGGMGIGLARAGLKG